MGEKWFRSSTYKGWKYYTTRYGEVVVSANERTYVIMDICEEIKTVPETQSGYVWKLRAVYSADHMSIETALLVVESVHGPGIYICVKDWTDHMCLIEECGEYVGQVEIGKECTLNDLYFERETNV